MTRTDGLSLRGAEVGTQPGSRGRARGPVPDGVERTGGWRGVPVGGRRKSGRVGGVGALWCAGGRIGPRGTGRGAVEWEPPRRPTLSVPVSGRGRLRRRILVQSVGTGRSSPFGVGAPGCKALRGHREGDARAGRESADRSLAGWRLTGAESRIHGPGRGRGASGGAARPRAPSKDGGGRKSQPSPHHAECSLDPRPKGPSRGCDPPPGRPHEKAA